MGSIQLDISIIEKLKDAEGNVYALKTKVYTTKNKVSPPFKQAILTYVLGEGFSVHYDDFEMAVHLGIIQKKDDCYAFADVKIQGDLNFYRKMKTSPELFKAIQAAIEEQLAAQGV